MKVTRRELGSALCWGRFQYRDQKIFNDVSERYVLGFNQNALDHLPIFLPLSSMPAKYIPYLGFCAQRQESIGVESTHCLGLITAQVFLQHVTLPVCASSMKVLVGEGRMWIIIVFMTHELSELIYCNRCQRTPPRSPTAAHLPPSLGKCRLLPSVQIALLAENCLSQGYSPTQGQHLEAQSLCQKFP